jgi:hypothetical protein
MEFAIKRFICLKLITPVQYFGQEFFYGCYKTHERFTGHMTDALYGQFRDKLLKCVDDLPCVNGISDMLRYELKEKIAANTFNLVVLGQFKRGKTTLINALLGSDLLPVAVTPLTSVVTIIAYGDSLSINVFFNDGSRKVIGRDALANYVTEKGNPRNVKDVGEVTVFYPASFLRDGIRMVDTPGVGSVYQHNTDIAYRFLPRCDAALFMLSADQPISRPELDFLLDVKKYANKIFFLLNKADYISESELPELIEFTSEELSRVIGHNVKVFPISAKQALDGMTGGRPELVRDSNLSVFMDELTSFFLEEKGKQLIISAAGNLQRLIAQADLAVSVGIKALSESVAKIQENLIIFKKRRKELDIERQDFSILFDGETKRMFDVIVDSELSVFKKELEGRLRAQLETVNRENSFLSLRELHALLEREAIDRVRLSFDFWRQTLDERLSDAFERTIRRYVEKVKNMADDLMKLSSDLFSVSFNAAGTEAAWSVKSGFYYKFRFEPVSLEILTSSLVLSLPRVIGKSLVLKRMKDFLARMIDMQSGRIRYDFLQRLEKSRMDFEAEMKKKMDTTAEGIENAIQQGIRLRAQGNTAIEARIRELSENKATLERIMLDLTVIKTDLDAVLPERNAHD